MFNNLLKVNSLGDRRPESPRVETREESPWRIEREFELTRLRGGNSSQGHSHIVSTVILTTARKAVSMTRSDLCGRCRVWGAEACSALTLLLMVKMFVRIHWSLQISQCSAFLHPLDTFPRATPSGQTCRCNPWWWRWEKVYTVDDPRGLYCVWPKTWERVQILGWRSFAMTSN